MRYLTATDIAWHRTTGLPVICYSSTAGGYFASGGQRATKSYDNPTSRAAWRKSRRIGPAIELQRGPNRPGLLALPPVPGDPQSSAQPILNI